MSERTALTVSELNSYMKKLVDSDLLLREVAIRGELSNYKIYPSGHHYFTMKDETGALKCVMFRWGADKLRFRPENGMKVIAFGNITVYPRDGVYQLNVSAMTPDGVGDLQIAFEQLKEKLALEGLFDAEHKKPIPKFPMRVAVVTSSAGAAVHDIIRVMRKRWPAAKILLLPVRVQGVEAPPEIAGAIRYANAHALADVMIVGRGGGSMEDLWCFNDERVARAIYNSDIPVISAVGHEPDFTIADFVADLRAATPSNGAELCAPDVAELSEYMDSLGIRAGQVIKKNIAARRERLAQLAGCRAMQNPLNYIADRRAALAALQTRFTAGEHQRIMRSREKFASLAGKLDAMSPLKVLGRGYSIARKPDGGVIKSASDVKSGDKLTINLQKDSINCTVD